MITAQELGQIEMFTGLHEAQLARLALLTREMTVVKGTYLFQEGSAASDIYILMSGKVTIQVQLTSRPEQIVIASLQQTGQLVGWSGLVDAEFYSASAFCQEPSRLLVFNGKALDDAMKDDCELGYHIARYVMEVISSRLRNIQRLVLKTL